MQLPILHLNGTSKEYLSSKYHTAGSAVDAAIKALAETAPHGRDYYPEPGAYERAQAEHESRMKRLHDIYEELGELYGHTL